MRKEAGQTKLKMISCNNYLQQNRDHKCRMKDLENNSNLKMKKS